MIMGYKRLTKNVVIFILSLPLVPNIYAQSNYKMTPNDMEGPYYPESRLKRTLFDIYPQVLQEKFVSCH